MQRKQLGTTVLRVVVGLVFFIHGWQKLFTFGVDGTTQFFQSLNIPAASVAAVVVIAVEFLGGLALILGFMTRPAALALAINMLVALFTVHLENGFFAGANGYEFVLTLFAACVALVLLGPGALALDAALPFERRLVARFS